MALNGTIQSVEQHLKNCWQKIEDKGGDLPAQLNLANLAQAIEDLPSGPIGYGTYGELQKAIRNGTAQEKFPVGTEIPDTYGGADLPSIIVNYEIVKDKVGNEHPGAILCKKYLIPVPENATVVYSNVYEVTGYPGSTLANYMGTILDACSDELQSALQEVQIPCMIKDSVAAATYHLEYLTAKLFAPSASQLCASYQPQEGEAWQYLRNIGNLPTGTVNTAFAARIFNTVGGGASMRYWTRTIAPQVGYAYYIDGSDGRCAHLDATSNIKALVAFAIF